MSCRYSRTTAGDRSGELYIHHLSHSSPMVPKVGDVGELLTCAGPCGPRYGPPLVASPTDISNLAVYLVKLSAPGRDRTCDLRFRNAIAWVSASLLESHLTCSASVFSSSGLVDHHAVARSRWTSGWTTFDRSIRCPLRLFRAVDGLIELLTAAAEGDEATIVRSPRELTTHQAAKVLNVSRPTVVKLIDDGVLPERKVGSHRRVPLTDLLAFRQDLVAKGRAALDEMTTDAEELRRRTLKRQRRSVTRAALLDQLAIAVPRAIGELRSAD